MVKCGFDGCKKHLNGYFNVYHVPAAGTIVIKEAKPSIVAKNTMRQVGHLTN